MKLIIDSGGTKLSWRFIGQKVEQGQADGYSALHHEPEKLKSILTEAVSPLLPQRPEEVYYYGTGILGSVQQDAVATTIQSVWPQAKVEVNDDLLGAAHALCGHQAGIACILGTGSNSCYYDGAQITHKVPPLGYILGDEGSGTALGKALLKAYGRGQLGDTLTARFEKRFGDNLVDHLTRLYKQPGAQQYLGSFSKFIFQNLKEPAIYRMAYQELARFFDEVLVHYAQRNTVKVHFVGGVAFYFSNIVRQLGNDRGIAIGNIMEDPIAGLTLYHKTDLNI